MAITQESHIEILEKLPDGNFKIKYPKVKSKSGVTFDEHLADDAAHDRIVMGTYLGDGQASRKIVLGFTPSAIFINMRTGSTKSGNYFYGGLALNGHRIERNSTTPVVEIVNDGFNVHEGDFVKSNTDGSKYHYLAIK